VVGLLCALYIGAQPAAAQMSIGVSGTNVVLSFPTATNLFYDVQRADTLATNSWSAIASNFPGTGKVLTNIDVGAAGGPTRYYRVRSYTLAGGTGSVYAVTRFTDGTPAQFAQSFIAYPSSSSNFHYGGWSDTGGGLTFSNVPVGSFTVRAYSPANGDLFAETNGTLTVNGGVANVTVLLPGTGAADVLVKYANGSPAEAAPVYIMYAVGSSIVTNGPQDTAISGHIIIQSVPVGNFTVKASNPHNLGSSATAAGTIISNGALANVTVNLLTN
jgi:hypothetical protein